MRAEASEKLAEETVKKMGAKRKSGAQTGGRKKAPHKPTTPPRPPVARRPATPAFPPTPKESPRDDDGDDYSTPTFQSPGPADGSSAEEQLTPCKRILKHYKRKGEVWVRCRLEGSDGNERDETFALRDAWVDYPEAVTAYQEGKKLKDACWRKPTLEGMHYIVRILGLKDDEEPVRENKEKVVYVCVGDNGHVEEFTFDEMVQEESEKLVDEFYDYYEEEA